MYYSFSNRNCIIYLLVGKEPYEPVISNNKDSEIAEATTNKLIFLKT